MAEEDVRKNVRHKDPAPVLGKKSWIGTMTASNDSGGPILHTVTSAPKDAVDEIM